MTTRGCGTSSSMKQQLQQSSSGASQEAERRRVTLRKTSLSQAHKHLQEALAWACQAAAAETATTARTTQQEQENAEGGGGGEYQPSSPPRSPTKAAAATAAIASAACLQPNLAALRKYLGTQLEAVSSADNDQELDCGAATNPGGGGGGSGGTIVAKELRQVIQLSVRASVQAAGLVSRLHDDKHTVTRCFDQGLRSALTA